MLSSSGILSYWLCSVYLSFWLAILSIVVSQIPLGSRISVSESNLWVSSGGEFTVGFFSHPDQANLFSVGVRFNSIGIPVSQRAVLWVAGADIVVSNRSYFEFMHNGELVLYDYCKESIVWSSKTSHLFVTSGDLLDNGNLVLMNGSKGIVWQSFDTPSDTLLPGQSLSLSQMLRAASKNSISSYYSLCLNQSGHLQLRWQTGVIYWTSSRSSSFSSRILTLTLTSTGALELLDDKLKPIWSVYSLDHNDSVDYRFLRLDIDGNLRIYSWVVDSVEWQPVWQAVENQCDVFATCNDCGICMYNASGSPSCECPFSQATESNLKCLLPYVQNCGSRTSMVAYKNMFLYGIYPPNDTVIRSDSQQCKNSCFFDPMCSAVTYTNDGSAECRMMKTQYVTGHSSARLRSISFIKTCLDPVAVFPNISSSSSSHHTSVKSYWSCRHCQVETALGIFSVFLAVQITLLYWIWRRRKSSRKEARSTYARSNSSGLIVFSYSEILEIALDFKHGMGPSTFKGFLPGNKPVVVKQLNVETEERKFRSVVMRIGSIHHRNLIKLEGYCCELGHRVLVYQFAKNGSLDNCVKNATFAMQLDWIKRTDICLSVARAISYLHSGCRELFSHGRLDCRTVLLDENLEVRVTKFGLGELRCNVDCEDSPSDLDVGDFGRMVITLVSARFDDENLYEWAYDRWREGEGVKVMDERMGGDVDMEMLERTLRIAFWCLQADGRLRPPMEEVVKVLEGLLSVDPPPLPFVSRRTLDVSDSPGMSD